MVKKEFIGQMHLCNRYGEKQSGELKLDAIDKKILYFLRVNARFSNSFIASQLNLKRETVSYRVRRMEELNFIQGYSTVIDPTRIGLKNHIILIKLKSFKFEKDILNYLVTLKEVTRLHNCSGSFDIQVSCTTKHDEEFNQFFNTLINQFHDAISNYEILSVIKEGFMEPTFFIDKDTINRLNLLERKGSSFQKDINLQPTHSLLGLISLTNEDKQILRELRLNARISITELSAKTGLVPATVDSKIKKLIQSGVIKSFYAIPAFSMLGYQWYRLFFRVKNLEEKRFLTFLKFKSNASWFMSTIGKWNYLVAIFAKDNVEFYKILDEIRTEFTDNILNYDSIIIFNRFKDVQRIE